MRSPSLILAVLTASLSSISLSAELPQTVRTDFASFDGKGIAAQFLYKVTILHAPKRMSEEDLSKLKASMEARKENPVIVQEMLRMASNEKESVDTKIVEVVVHDGVMKCSWLPKVGGSPKAIDYVNGDLMCTASHPEKSGEYFIQKSSFYASPFTMGQRFLPWYLGVFSLQRLFKDQGEVIERPDETVISRTFQWEKNRSVHIEAHRSKDAGKYSFQVIYGKKANEPTDFCELSNWKTIDGVSVPTRSVISMMRQADGTLDRRITAELISAKSKNVEANDLKSLGPIGKEVTDCRLGMDACVRYKIKDQPLSDEEVEVLLAAKDRKGQLRRLGELPPPSAPITPPTLILYGLGAVGLGGLSWLCLRRLRRRHTPDASE